MAGKPKVFVSRIIPDAGLRLIRERCEAEVWPDFNPPPRAEVMRRAADIDGIVSLLTDGMDAEFMDAAPMLRVISNYAVGFDNVDVPAATQRGIPVGHTPGVLTETTADFAFALLMAAARRVVEGMDYVRSGQWTTWGPLLLLGQDIHHATLGLVGLGRIGTEMAKRAKGFDMRVVYYDAFRQQDKEAELGIEYLPLEDVLREADFVSLHTPLTPETHHLMNARTLGLMKPTAIVINTSRGPVIDPDALYDALKVGTISGAGLDVTEPEPLPRDHKLLTLPNCVVAPHIASASVATRDAMAVLAAENLFAGLEGKPLKATPNPNVKPRLR
ncbi:MAG: D-glycerate dehydrogenase [Chloroflexi bacterium]|nr:D-glycerate dehydrogenase [Chloroflexota bacterium]